MSSRPASVAAFLFVAGLGIARAQTPPDPNPAPTPAPTPAPAPTEPPAAPAEPQAAPAGAPRHTSTATLGTATVTIEHGQPPWNDQRVGQMAQIAQQGQPWRLGSEGITTFEVKGSPIFVGEELIKAGRYGMNLVATGENAWALLLFDPLHADQTPVMAGDEPSWRIPAAFIGDAPEVVAAMTIDVVAQGETATCTVAWGPLRMSATMGAAAVSTAELSLNGNEAHSNWYRRALPAGHDCSKPMIAGTVDFEIDGEDCSMNVYVMHEGDQVVALLRNKEREAAELQTVSLADNLKRMDAMIQQFGAQAEAQIGPMKQRVNRMLVKHEITLEDTVNRPDNLKFAATAEAAGGSSLACDIFQTRSSLNLEVVIGAKKAIVRIDESLFALKAESSRP